MSGVLGKAEPLHLRLFIENVEVPVIGAIVSATEGSPATAQIEMVPGNSAMHFTARSKILLFWLDAGDIGLGTARAVAEGQEEILVEASAARELTSAGYKLLFSGELFSMAWTKVGFGGRNLVLQCLDDSNNWDTSYLYTLNYAEQAQESVVANSTQTFLGLNADTGAFDDIVSSPEQVIRRIAQRSAALSRGLSGSGGMLGGLLGILELVGGVAGKYVGITAWHTIQEARVRLIDQIAADSGATALNLFDFTAFDTWLTGRIGEMGTVISFRELLGLICSYIFYNVAPNPVGVYRPGSRDPKTAAVPTAGASKSVVIPDITKDLSSYTAQSADVKKTLDVIQSVFDSHKIPREVTAAAMVNAQAESAFNASASGDGGHSIGLFQINDRGTVDGHPTPWATGQPGYLTVEQRSDPRKNAEAILQDPHIGDVTALFTSGERDVAVLAAKWCSAVERPKSAAQAAARGQAASALFCYATVQTKVEAAAEAAASADKREHLYTQYFRPDVWFVPPPACNVVFPEEVSNLSFARDMLRETTRMRLQSFNHVIGDDVITNRTFWAPVIEGVKSLADGGLGTAAKALIYPHEKFSGIVPKMERMSDLAFYSRSSGDQVIKDDGTTASAEETKTLGPTDTQLDKFAQRTTVFTFLSYRYSARRMDLNLKFTPRVVCGYPMLVIDRTAPEGMTADERKTSEFSPNHYIGMVRSLTHRLDQSGGSTSVTLSHVRTHKSTMDDIFASSVYDNKGILAVQVQSVNDTTINIDVNDTLDSLEYNFLVQLKQRVNDGMDLSAPTGILSPNGRALVGAITVVPSVVTSKTGTTSLPVTGATNLGSGVAGPVQQDTFPWKKVMLTERGDTSYIPLEEAMRPPWISDEYSNKSIGTLYKSLFGCPSVMDLYSDLKPGSVNGVKFSEPSIADAVEKIVDQYTAMSDGGYLGASFIRELTQRDYATISDVIGTDKTPGYFWQSSGNYQGLEGSMFSWMVGSSSKAPTTQLSPTEENKVDPGLDPRKDRWKRAVSYRDELLRSAGLRG